MQLSRTMPAKGVYLNTLKDTRFKKQRISVFMSLPLERETVTTNVLLPYLLERSTLDYPSPTLLQRKLMSLYGASFSCNFSKILDRAILSLQVEGPCGKYLPEDNVDKAYVDFIMSCVTNPHIENGAFGTEAVEIEKEKLRQLIASQYNDKRYYCQKKAFAELYKDDPRGIDGSGYPEDIDGITPILLARQYNRFLTEGAVEIFAVNCDISASDLTAFGQRIAPPIHRLPAVGTVSKTNTVHIKDAVNQDNITMQFTCGKLFDRRERLAFRLGCLIYGGLATSRLFMNVREKQSLCYFCSALPDLLNSTITVSTGVDSSNAQKACDAIVKELDILCTDITDKELAEAKLAIKNAYLELEDNIVVLSKWYSGEILSGSEPETPSDDLKAIMTITKDEVCSIMSLFRLNTVCRLGKDLHE